jgi:tRNA(fMet)-specific endonuclease VapC
VLRTFATDEVLIRKVGDDVILYPRCSHIMKRSHPLVLKRLQSVPIADVCMSVISKAELLYGVEVSPRRPQDAAALAALLPYVEVIALDDNAARHYAEIRADLKRRGALIGANDLFIAAHASARADAGD